MSAEPWTLQPACPPSVRPEALFDPTKGVHGLRAAQVAVGPPRVLKVWLYAAPPAALLSRALWTLEPAPGAATVAIAAAAAQASPSPHVELTLAGAPDRSRYRLLVAPPASVPFDPLRTWLPVRLRPECPDLGSCFEPDVPPPLPPASPVLDYRARDWTALRAALIEYLLRRDPDADLSIADPTITLIELFAHAGDLLNYRLDRVATEAYLESARLRTSVKRHARLVDFAVGEGLAARTFVHVAVAPGAGAVNVNRGSVAVDVEGSELAFTLEQDVKADARVGEIPLYDWGEEACCLPAGATECVLVRPLAADPLGNGWLAAGDLLAFEIVDPDDEARHRSWARRTQQWPTDAAGTARFRAPLPSRAAQVVELTAIEPFSDPLLGSTLSLFRVTWRAEDALREPYPVGVDASSGEPEVTVARACLAPAHHGRLVDGPPGSTLAPRVPDWADAATWPPAEFSLTAAGHPGRGRRPGGPGLALAPAAPPERAQPSPYRLDVSVALPSGVTVPATLLSSLLDARAGEYSVVVDVEDDEPPVLRFATGAVGLAPPFGSTVAAAYEVGGGTRGNVPANAVTLLEENTAAAGQPPAWQSIAGVSARNPMAAAGGAEPTPLDVVRRDAPEAYAAEPRRAVLPADHAAAAMESPLVERAVARRAWSGSWPVIDTVVDLRVAGDAAAEARGGVQALLDDLRMLGTEAAVLDATPIGLLIALVVCARPGSEAEQVRTDILRVLRPGTDSRPGFFHPSRLQLGGTVYLSGVVAAVAALPAVDAVEITEARRLGEPPSTVHDVLTFGPFEVAVLDDDVARPERGRLDVTVRGGR